MNVRLLFILLAVIAISNATALQTVAQEKKTKERLAVLDLEAKHGVEKSFAEALSVIIRDKIHSYGDYQVMSIDDIEKVASREQMLQAMGCDDGSGQCLVDFGRTIGSRFMVAGDIAKLGSTYTVSLRMLDTQGENAGVTHRASETCQCTDDAMIVTAENVAAKLIGKPAAVAGKKAEKEKAQPGADASNAKGSTKKNDNESAEKTNDVRPQLLSDETAPVSTMWEDVVRLVNMADFGLMVEIDRLAYTVGEQMEIFVNISENGYLNILNLGARDEKITVLFPNRFVKENKVRAGQKFSLPGSAGRFKMTAQPPAGDILIAVLLSEEPLNLWEMNGERTRESFRSLESQEFRQFVVEAADSGMERKRLGAAKIITTIKAK